MLRYTFGVPIVPLSLARSDFRTGRSYLTAGYKQASFDLYGTEQSVFVSYSI